MGKIVKRYKSAKVIRELALAITRRLPNKSWVREAAAIHSWVKDNIRYIKDVHGVETLQTPIQTLRLRQGDCDDHAMLVASLMEAIGHPTRFVAVGFQKGHYAHVLAQTKIGNKWVAMETTENWPLGKMPPNIVEIMTNHN